MIVRTVAEGVTEEHFKREIDSLLAPLEEDQPQEDNFVRAPALVQRETSLTRGIIRDLFSAKVDALCVDSKELYNEIEQYLEQIDPELMDRVQLVPGARRPCSTKFDIENGDPRISSSRACDLPTGGYIIIQPTEALVSIDVNTGRYTGKKDPEKTILRTNLDAAREIARQLRLRDIGGIIVCDFIDMETRAEPRQGAPGAAEPPRPGPGPHQGLRRLGAGADRDDPPAGAPLALAFDDRRLPHLRRHRPGLHPRSRGPAAGAVAQAGRARTPGAAARGPAPPRGGALPAGGGAEAVQIWGSRPGSTSSSGTTR